MKRLSSLFSVGVLFLVSGCAQNAAVTTSPPPSPQSQPVVSTAPLNWPTPTSAPSPTSTATSKKTTTPVKSTPPTTVKTTTTTAKKTTASTVVAVSIQNFAFSPATLTIKKGSTVKWTNLDSAPHQVAGDSLTALLSAPLAQGQTYSFTFTQAGTFTYHCKIHHSMTGTIVVQ